MKDALVPVLPAVAVAGALALGHPRGCSRLPTAHRPSAAGCGPWSCAAVVVLGAWAMMVAVTLRIEPDVRATMFARLRRRRAAELVVAPMAGAVTRPRFPPSCSPGADPPTTPRATRPVRPAPCPARSKAVPHLVRPDGPLAVRLGPRARTTRAATASCCAPRSASRARRPSWPTGSWPAALADAGCARPPPRLRRDGRLGRGARTTRTGWTPGSPASTVASTTCATPVRSASTWSVPASVPPWRPGPPSGRDDVASLTLWYPWTKGSQFVRYQRALRRLYAVGDGPRRGRRLHRDPRVRPRPRPDPRPAGARHRRTRTARYPRRSWSSTPSTPRPVSPAARSSGRRGACGARAPGSTPCSGWS